MSVSFYDQHLETRQPPLLRLVPAPVKTFVRNHTPRAIRKLIHRPNAPQQLDPLHGIPAEEIYKKYAVLILRVPRRYKKRAFDHSEQKRPGHSHIIVTLSAPHEEPIHVAFDPKTPIDHEKFEHWLEPAKLFVPDIWLHRAGAVFNEEARLHDTARVYILETKVQYKAAKNEINRWRKNPPDYQVTGFTAPNCARFAFSIMTVAGIHVPPEWYATPWPHVIADDIEKQARKGDANPWVRNITAGMTVEAFAEHQERLGLLSHQRIVPLPPSEPAMRRFVERLVRKPAGRTPQIA